MSFSGEQKRGLLAEPYKLACCRRSFLVGILLAKGELVGEETVFRIESAESARTLMPQIAEAFGKEAEISPSRRGGRGCELVLASRSAARLLRENREEILYFPALRCRGCRDAFLAGVFFVAGRISDPSKQFCLEFSFGNKISVFQAFFAELGLSPHVATRRTERLLYFRETAAIEDFFALAGMTQTAFLFMNRKIENEFRNNANRVTNCETNNIQRAVSACAEQTARIEELWRRGLLSRLPESLEETARLRLAYRDLSLSQLAQRAVPPLTKSGLAHRLAKIAALTDELLSDAAEGR